MIKALTKTKLKRSTAFVFFLFKVIDLTWLYFWPESHHVAILTSKGVSNAVLIALITSQDALTWGALAVYGWAKSKGAD